MRKIRFTDSTELTILQVVDVGKRVIDDINRKVYEFQYLAADHTFDEINTIHSDPVKMEHFVIREPVMVVDKDAAGNDVPGSAHIVIDETTGDVMYADVPNPPEAVANRDGFTIKLGVELRRVEITAANYEQAAVTEERLIATMAQRQYWERS